MIRARLGQSKLVIIPSDLYIHEQPPLILWWRMSGPKLCVSIIFVNLCWCSDVADPVILQYLLASIYYRVKVRQPRTDGASPQGRH